MEELISVVVPVYNVEKYIDKCINSIINQTYKNLEIILVDDGSPDNCGNICDEYAKKDNRIIVIHKENGGLSDARNTGIEVSKGKYITFIDSDDYISDNYVSFLYNLIIEYKADISIGKHYVLYENGEINTATGKKYELEPKQALEMMLYGDDLDVSAWAKLYKKELFETVRYPKGRLFEDAATTYKLIDLSKKIIFHSEPIYYYIMRSDSISNKSFNDKKMDLITSTNEMSGYISDKYEDLKKACDRRLMYSYLSTLTQLAKSDVSTPNYNKYKNELMNYIKTNRKKVLKDPKIPKRDRVALECTKFGFGFFKWSWRIYEKLTKRK